MLLQGKPMDYPLYSESPSRLSLEWLHSCIWCKIYSRCILLHMLLYNMHCRLSFCRCFQVFKVIHQLVDSEEDILMVNDSLLWRLQSNLDGGVYKEPFISTGCESCYSGVCCRWGKVFGTAQHPTWRTKNRLNIYWRTSECGGRARNLCSVVL